MEWLNYHHLLYFWTVAREGTISRASKKLLLAPSTISGQLRALERSLQTRLFERVGRNLVLTDAGRIVYRYADEIFSLGQDLRSALAGTGEGRALRLEVGVADVLPRWIVFQLLEPAMRLPEPVQLVCHDDKTDRLLSRLALNELDVVITDVPAGPLTKIRAYNHLLGECGISFLAAKPLVNQLRRGFPKSLDRAPFILPMEGTALRKSLDEWFSTNSLRPQVLCEIGDCDLFEVFGHAGLGIFVAPTILERRIQKQFAVNVLGRVESLREKYYAVSTERKLKHPAVLAISEAARRQFAH